MQIRQSQLELGDEVIAPSHARSRETHSRVADHCYDVQHAANHVWHGVSLAHASLLMVHFAYSFSLDAPALPSNKDPLAVALGVMGKCIAGRAQTGHNEGQ
jgi:hypothetical protein